MSMNCPCGKSCCMYTRAAADLFMDDSSNARGPRSLAPTSLALCTRKHGLSARQLGCDSPSSTNPSSADPAPRGSVTVTSSSTSVSDGGGVKAFLYDCGISNKRTNLCANAQKRSGRRGRACVQRASEVGAKLLGPLALDE
eukprot:1193150-Prorocentrum_minimum.AAC.1